MTYPAYCGVTDVLNFLAQGGFSSGFTTTSTPTLSQVTAWLGYRAGEIDSALKHRGLQTPLTSPPEFVEELLMLNAMGVAAWVGNVAWPSTQSPGKSKLADGWEGMYQARLTEIRAGVGVPVNIAVFESDLAPRSFFTDSGAYGMPNGSVTDAYGNPIDADPYVTMGKKW